MHLRSFTIILIAITLSACGGGTKSAARFAVTVNAFAEQPKAPPRTFVLVPGNQGVNRGDLEFKEYAKYVSNILQAKGMHRVNNDDQADIAVYIAYGLGEPKEETEVKRIPQYGVVGYSAPIGGVSYPQYGQTGVQEKTTTYTTFFRSLVIEALDMNLYRATKAQNSIWKVTVTSRGSSNDLRRVVPPMMLAASYYIGKSSGGKKAMSIYENDPGISRIKYGKLPKSNSK